MKQRANIKTKQYSASVSLPANQNRSYFILYVLTGTVSVELGNGGGALPFQANQWYEPYVIPISQIDIVTSGGTFVVGEA